MSAINKFEKWQGKASIKNLFGLWVCAHSLSIIPSNTSGSVPSGKYLILSHDFRLWTLHTFFSQLPFFFFSPFLLTPQHHHNFRFISLCFQFSSFSPSPVMTFHGMRIKMKILSVVASSFFLSSLVQKCIHREEKKNSSYRLIIL